MDMEPPVKLQTWVDAACRGDPAATAKLLAAYHPVLRARAESRMERAVRARFEPEDVLQHVYVQAARQINQFRGSDPESFLNWVLTILDHKLIDAWRACHRQGRDVGRECQAIQSHPAASYWNLMDHVEAASDTPSRIVRKEEAIEALSACVAGLADHHRRVIEMRFLEGLPVADVAARLNTTKAAVIASTRRALTALRRSMDRLGEFTRGA